MTNYRLNKPVIFMFKDYKSENNVVGICSLKTVALMFLLLPFLLSSIACVKKLIIITNLFKKLIYETQNNLN